MYTHFVLYFDDIVDWPFSQDTYFLMKLHTFTLEMCISAYLQLVKVDDRLWKRLLIKSINVLQVYVYAYTELTFEYNVYKQYPKHYYVVN